MSDERLPEEELLRRAVGGEDLAVRQLLLPHLAHLSWIIADKYPQLAQGMSTVDDIVQETFTESYRQIQDFEVLDPGVEDAQTGPFEDLGQWFELDRQRIVPKGLNQGPDYPLSVFVVFETGRELGQQRSQLIGLE